MTAAGLLLLVGAGFLAAVVQALTGAGFGLVAVPLVILLAPNLIPGPLLIVTVILMIVVVVTGYRTGGRLKRSDARLLGPATAGITIGALVMLPALGWVGEHEVMVNAIVGTCVLAAVIPLLLPGFSAPAVGERGMAGAGVLAGILTVVAALPGPPLILVYPAKDAARYRTGLAVLFLIASIIAVAVLEAGPGIAPGHWGGLGWFAFGVLLGSCAGVVVGRRLPLAWVIYGSRLTVLSAAAALLVPVVT